MKYSKQVKAVLEILQNEVDGDVREAMEKLTPDYKMTWVYEGKDEELFPSTTVDVKDELDDVYHIKGRRYDIRNITENENVVMIEMIESYPDPKNGQMYKTPQVIVLEMEGGKIRTGRHYTDPRLSYKELNDKQINEVLRDTDTKMMIKQKKS